MSGSVSGRGFDVCLLPGRVDFCLLPEKGIRGCLCVCGKETKRIGRGKKRKEQERKKSNEIENALQINLDSCLMAS